jgi:sulfoxide reductase heme-binding subunit YedZ
MTVLVRRVCVFVILLVPFIYILQKIIRLQLGEWEILGPEPEKEILQFTGQWAFNCLIITLLITPVKTVFNVNWVQLHRRMCGLFTMFYAVTHLYVYLSFLLDWNIEEFFYEITHRWHLIVGMLAWFGLCILSITSFRFWKKALKRNWKKLHRIIYVIAILCSLHYLLQVRSSWFDPVVYASIVFLLLMVRMITYYKNVYIDKKYSPRI